MSRAVGVCPQVCAHPHQPKSYKGLLGFGQGKRLAPSPTALPFLRQSGLSDHPLEVALRSLSVHVCVKGPVRKAQSSSLGPTGGRRGIAGSSGPLSGQPQAWCLQKRRCPGASPKRLLSASKFIRASLSFYGVRGPAVSPKHTLCHPCGPACDQQGPEQPVPELRPGPSARLIIIHSGNCVSCQEGANFPPPLAPIPMLSVRSS